MGPPDQEEEHHHYNDMIMQDCSGGAVCLMGTIILT